MIKIQHVSTPDERHYKRVFNGNPPAQESFLIHLLSMRENYLHGEGARRASSFHGAGAVVTALEVVIAEFAEQHTEWKDEKSVVYGGVKEVLEIMKRKFIDEVGIEAIPIGRVPEDVADWSIDHLDLNVRAWRALRKCGITAIGEIGNLSIKELKEIPGIWLKTIDNIVGALDKDGWLILELSKGTSPNERLK